MRKFKYFLLGRLFPCALALLSLLGISLAFAYWLRPLLVAIGAIERIFSWGVALYTLRQDEMTDVKYYRLLLLLFLPWVGAFCCLFWGRKKPLPKPEFFYFSDGLMNVLSHAPHGDSLASGRVESAEFFSDGRQAFPRLLNDLAAAEKFIYLEFYIVDRGAFRDAVFSILEKKGKEGVCVRVLYDDFGCALTLPRRFSREMVKRGIRAYPFCPLSLKNLPKINCRDHRKCVIIDGDIAYTGGMNLADEYIGERVRFGHWKDSFVRLQGGVANEFTKMFERTWKECFPCEKAPYFYTKKEVGDVDCIPFTVRPYEGKNSKFYHLLLTLLERAKETVYLTTPYLSPNEGILRAMQKANLSGDIRLLIPHRPDKRSVFILTREAARRLEKRGVKVREYEAGFLHAKNVVCDREYAIVSSCNLDMRSLRLQYECGALIRDKQLAVKVEQDFLGAWEQGVPVPPATLWEKLAYPFLRALSLLL